MFDKLKELLKSLHDSLDNAQLAMPDDRWTTRWQDVYWQAVREIAALECKQKTTHAQIASMGGKACAAKMTPQQRTERAKKAGAAQWKPYQVGERLRIIKVGTEGRGPFLGKPHDHCEVGTLLTVVSADGLHVAGKTDSGDPVYFSQRDKRYFERVA